METFIGLWICIVIIYKITHFLFVESPKISRQQKEERLIRRYGKERYMEMKNESEAKHQKKLTDNFNRLSGGHDPKDYERLNGYKR